MRKDIIKNSLSSLLAAILYGLDWAIFVAGSTHSFVYRIGKDKDSFEHGLILVFFIVLIRSSMFSFGPIISIVLNAVNILAVMWLTLQIADRNELGRYKDSSKNHLFPTSLLIAFVLVCFKLIFSLLAVTSTTGIWPLVIVGLDIMLAGCFFIFAKVFLDTTNSNEDNLKVLRLSSGLTVIYAVAKVGLLLLDVAMGMPVSSMFMHGVEKIMCASWFMVYFGFETGNPVPSIEKVVKAADIAIRDGGIKLKQLLKYELSTKEEFSLAKSKDNLVSRYAGLISDSFDLS